MTQRVLMLLKIDANNVFQRIKERKTEYLEIFALRRTREHFPMIFDNSADRPVLIAEKIENGSLGILDKTLYLKLLEKYEAGNQTR